MHPCLDNPRRKSTWFFNYFTLKVATHCREQNKKKGHDNWLKNKKVIQSNKMSKIIIISNNKGTKQKKKLYGRSKHKK